MSKSNVLLNRSQDRREGGSRTKVMLLAAIKFDDAQEFLVFVRDLSSVGAKIAVSQRYTIPLRFNIIIGEQGEPHSARRMWRRGDYVGVMFTATVDE